jgi:hypothetical protein
MIVEKVTKKSIAIGIFNQELAARERGKHKSNRDFRKTVLNRMVAEAGVTNASAASMYNLVKVMAEKADPTLVLGRDPKPAVPVKVKREKVAKVKVVAPVTEPADAV